MGDNATYSMVNVEVLLTNIIKDMQTFNDTNTNATVAAGLKNDVDDQLDRLDNWGAIGMLSGFYFELASRATVIQNEGAAIKNYITDNTDKISTYADNVNAKIADLKAAIDQFLADVQDAHNKSMEQIMGFFTHAEEYMSETYGAASDLQWATGELKIYGATSKYANKLNQIQGLIDEMNATIATNKAKAETITKIGDLYTLAQKTWSDAQTLYNNIRNDLNEIVALAKTPFVNAACKALQDQLDAIVINADEYTNSDKATLDAMKGAIQTDINELKSFAMQAYHDDPEEGTINHDAAVTKAILDEGTEKFNKDLKALRDKMKELNFTQDVKGHITGGEEIGTNDIQALANIIITGQEGDVDPEVCDINGDGRVTVTDIIWLQYFWAFNEWPNPAAAARGDIDMNDGVNMEVVSTRGNITRLAINLNNSDSYRAFQIGMQLPAGAKVVGQSLGDRVQNANLMRSESAMGNVRFLTMTSLNSSFEGNEGAVLYVDIENLNGDVTLTEAYFTNSEMNEAAFVNNGQTTSIRESITNALESAGQKIYNMGGRVMNGLKKGINIIRRNDGSNEKVIVK